MRRGIGALSLGLALVAALGGAANGAGRKARAYRDMTESGRQAFVVERARRIGGELCGDGRNLDVSADLAAAVRAQLDALVSERRTGDRTVSAILARGTRNAQTINAAFRSANLPAALGLALAMSESEFGECPTSPAGARGMFQFMPATGARFGLDGDGLCDVGRSAAAAAAYHRQLRSAFPGSAAGPLVAALAYNTGERAAEAAFGDIARRDDDAAIGAFWQVALTGSNAAGQPVLSDEGRAYLPRLIACAIVVETPGAFGLDSGALSGK